MHLEIRFVGVKNDVFNEGGTKLVPANTKEPLFCPVQLTRDYLQYLGPGYHGSMQPRCKGGSDREPDPEIGVSYTNALQDLRKLMSTIGYGDLKIGEHSAK